MNNEYSTKKEIYNTKLVKKFEDNCNTLEKMIDFPNCALKQLHYLKNLLNSNVNYLQL